MGFFRKLIEKIYPFLKPILNFFLDAATAAAKEIALSVVMEVANDHEVLTNEEKRKLAFDRIKGAAESKGMNLRTSAINFAIEWAVMKLKDE